MDDLLMPVVANAESAQSAQPTDGPFHHPANLTQSTSMSSISTPNVADDAATLECLFSGD